MQDPYATIATQDESLQDRLADVLELRGADPVQTEMMQAYLSELTLAPGTRALEIGCGTGVVTRAIAGLENVAHATGIDPSPVFIERATELAPEGSNTTFAVGDGQALDLPDASFELVVMHTTLCHVPDPDLVLAEAKRVLAPGGSLAIFDGDYTTASVATSASDPLQTAVDTAIANFVAHPWMSRRLPRALSSLGLETSSFRSHGYTRVSEAAYMLSILERGLDIMTRTEVLGADAASALRTETHRRHDSGEFFAHISYVSAIARKPA